MRRTLQAAQALAEGDEVLVTLSKPEHMEGEIVEGLVTAVYPDSVDVQYENLVDGAGWGNHPLTDVVNLDEDMALAANLMAAEGDKPREDGVATKKRMAELKEAGEYGFDYKPGEEPIWTKNEKLGKSGIAAWGIPAWMTPAVDAQGKVKRDKDGNIQYTKICHNAGECGRDYACYAQNGTMGFPTSRLGAQPWRYVQTLQPDFVQKMDAWVKKKGDKYVRVHDSGDFYSLKYLKDWYEIARLNPDKQFYAYTKMVSMAKNTKSEQPKNWRWLFSFGGKEDKLIQESDFHSVVFDNLADLEAAGYVNNSEADEAAAWGTNPKIGLVVHHSSKAGKGSWRKHAPEWVQRDLAERDAKAGETRVEKAKAPAEVEETPVEANLKADYGKGFTDPTSPERYFGKKRENAVWSIANDKKNMETAQLDITVSSRWASRVRGRIAGMGTDNGNRVNLFDFYFTASPGVVDFDDNSVDYYPEYKQKLSNVIQDKLFGDTAKAEMDQRFADIDQAGQEAEAEGRRAAGGDGSAAGRGRAQRRGVNGAAPYTAPAEPKGTAYKNGDKFLPREGLYNGKASPKDLDPNDLTKPGAKKMPISGPIKAAAQRVLKAILAFKLKADQDLTVSFKVFLNAQGMEAGVEVYVKPAEMADQLNEVLLQAGFEQVEPGVYDRSGTSAKEAMQAFEGAVAVSEGFEVVDKSDNALVVTKKAGVAAALAEEVTDVEVDAKVYEKAGVGAGEELPATVWPGGYPLFYLDADGEPVCPACANAESWTGKHIVDTDVNWEDPDLNCVNCTSRIPSAYAEDAAPVDEKLQAKMAKKGAPGFVAKTTQNVELKMWEQPADYAGQQYPDYYRSGFGQSRDSTVYERANFDAALKELGGEHSTPEWEKAHPELAKEGLEEVMVAHASHWAVGWVESILVHKDSAQVAVLQELRNRFEDYPVVDEDLLSEYEMKQQEEDFESWGAVDMFQAIEGMEGIPEAEGYADLPDELQFVLSEAFYEAWGNSGGDLGDVAKIAQAAAQAWVSGAGTRDRKELEKAGQKSLPGIKKQFGAAFQERLPLMAAREYMKLHAEEATAPAKPGQDTETPKGRDVVVKVPKADAAKFEQVRQYFIEQGTAFDEDQQSDPMTLTATFFPAEGQLKHQPEEDYLQFLRGLGLSGQYVRGRSTRRPPMGIQTDAMTFASLVHVAAMSTEPQGNEVEASLHLAASQGVSTKLVFRQTRFGLVAESGRRRKHILATITPQAVIAWAKEN